MRKVIKLVFERPSKKEIYISVDAIQEVERRLVEISDKKYQYILRLRNGKGYYISKNDYNYVLGCFDIINA